MFRTISIAFGVFTTVALIGCGDQPATSDPTDPPTNTTIASTADDTWKADADLVQQLDDERSILDGAVQIQPPPAYEFEESLFGDSVAVFKDDPNRIEIMMTKGLSAKVTVAEFGATTQQLHANVSELQNVSVDKLQTGQFLGHETVRFAYNGMSGDQRIEGVYYLSRPDPDGPIWNLVVEGTPEQRPLLETSLLTIRLK